MSRARSTAPPPLVTPASRVFAKAFDVLPDSAAILDDEGRILAVNEAWCAFGAKHGGDPDGHVGTSYVRICRKPDPDRPGVEDASFAARGIGKLLAGEAGEVKLEYPCETPQGMTYFLMHAKRFEDVGRRYVLVRHVDITARKRIELRALERANHDDLTGLPTKARFVQRLEQSLARAAREGTRVAVAGLDLDGFKAVNDTHGHAAGDAVLEAVAHRMQATVRAVDALSRSGGDEFLLLMEDADAPGALRLAERIRDRLTEPVETGGVRCSVGVSIGIAFYPDDARGIGALLERADEAMYRAKEAGKGRALLYAPPEPRTALSPAEGKSARAGCDSGASAAPRRSARTLPPPRDPSLPGT